MLFIDSIFKTALSLVVSPEKTGTGVFGSPPTPSPIFPNVLPGLSESMFNCGASVGAFLITVICSSLIRVGLFMTVKLLSWFINRVCCWPLGLVPSIQRGIFIFFGSE